MKYRLKELCLLIKGHRENCILSVVDLISDDTKDYVCHTIGSTMQIPEWNINESGILTCKPY